MNRRFLVTTLSILVLAAAVLSTGCRSRVKPQTAPSAAAVETTDAPRAVESPARDFVTEQPAGKPVLSADLAELNRTARDRGWIRDAFFEFDSNTLDSSARTALESSARWLATNPDIKLVIEGHADDRGTQQYNLALGERRSHVAAEYLTVLGIAPGRVTTVSYGEERPFAEGSDEDAWSQNRRAHLVLSR